MSWDTISRAYCAHGELLKLFEQRLLFLKKCKSRDVYPSFIINNIKQDEQKVLFPSKVPSYVSRYIKRARDTVLNQHITNLYSDIASEKSQINKIREQVQRCTSSELCDYIQSVFETNNETIKQSEKDRLKKKIAWLCKKQWSQKYDIKEHEEEVIEIAEAPEKRVTSIQVNLTEEEKQLLALGPNYALKPRVDEKFITKVKIQMAAVAYQLRWKKQMEEVQGCDTKAQYLRKAGAPITKSFVRPPPNNNAEVEHRLKRLNTFVLHLYQNTKVDNNITHDQAVGLKSLSTKRDKLHISVSDKGGEFVVMERKAHYDLTKYHILSTDDTYKFIPPTRQYQGECKRIGTPTTTTYQRQLKTFAEKLETKCNDLWRNICHSRGFNNEVERYFCSYNTQLPTMYILLKTHKFQSDDN